MEKGKNESAKLTQECIATALMMLMESKDYDDISVTELTEKAGVSRMAYYRNYESKDDILINYLLDLGAELFDMLSKREFVSLNDLIVRVGLFLQSNYGVALACVKTGQGERLLEKIMEKIFSAYPEISGNTENEYRTAFYVGAILGVFKKWFSHQMEESVYEISDIICRLIDSDSAEKFSAR